MPTTIVSLKAIILIMFAFCITFLISLTTMRLELLKINALEVMEIEGCYNTIVNQKVIETCNNLNLEFSDLNINATTVKKNYGEKVQIEIEMEKEYNFILFKKTHIYNTYGSINVESIER